MSLARVHDYDAGGDAEQRVDVGTIEGSLDEVRERFFVEPLAQWLAEAPHLRTKAYPQYGVVYMRDADANAWGYHLFHIEPSESDAPSDMVPVTYEQGFASLTEAAFDAVLAARVDWYGES